MNDDANDLPFIVTTAFIRQCREFLEQENPGHDTIRVRADDSTIVYYLDTSTTRTGRDCHAEFAGLHIVSDPDDAKQLKGGTLGMLQTIRKYRLHYIPAVESFRATDPGRLPLSRRSLKRVQPELRGRRALRRRWYDWLYGYERYAARSNMSPTTSAKATAAPPSCCMRTST